MSIICQKSVCTALANGIIKRKVGYLRDIDHQRFGWFVDPDGTNPDHIVYCPYCGTHLVEIHEVPSVQRIAKAPKLALIQPVTQPVAIPKPQPIPLSVLLPISPPLQPHAPVWNDVTWAPPPPPPNWKETQGLDERKKYKHHRVNG